MLIGRRREQAVLREALDANAAELVAVYGRRRVGKTFLVREFFGHAIAFELTGSHASDMATQLGAFATALGRAAGTTARLATPRDWPEAFGQLEAHLTALRRRRGSKSVVFFDELPWLATRRSGFLAAFEHFWNGWASAQPWLVVVICGSSASWMLSKVVKQRGGLHNRVTRRLRMEPLSLAESNDYLHARGIRFGPEQALELYMAFGGVPHYLNQAKPGQSAAQTIDRACFARDGLLRDEFANLAKRTPLGHAQRDAVFHLTDQYSLFYLTWIAGHRSGGDGVWLRARAGARHNAWSGIAFESVCLAHVSAIKRVLGIGAVETLQAAWSHRPVDADDEGAQIDLVIDRADRSINLCEMKYAQDEFVVDKAYARELERKRETFRRITGTRKALFLTLVTTVGVRNNEHAQRLGLQVITLDELMHVPLEAG